MFMRRCSGVVSTWAVCALLCVLCAAPAAAQSGRRFEVGVQFVAAASEEFDTDPGVGVGLSWRPGALWSAEGEIAFYPTGLPQQSQFSRSRIEGLFGVGVGPLVGRVRPFARARAGFLTYRERSEPFPCIAIFPPPLVCAIGGDTVPSVQVTGGFEAFAGDRWVVRVEAGDQLLRYSGPAFTSDRDVIDEGLWSHNFKATASVGLRF